MDWTTFFGVCAGAAATLVGLLFIGVQVNFDVLGSDPKSGWSKLAQSTYAIFAMLFLSSLSFLIPSLHNRVRALVVIALAVVMAARTTVSAWITLRSGANEATERTPRMFLALTAPLLAYGIAAAGSFMWLAGRRSDDDAREIIAMAFLALFALGLRNSWSLLFEFRRPPRSQSL